MAFAYSSGLITQTGTETGNDQLAGLSGLTGVTTTTLGERTVYSIDSSTRIHFNGTCVIDPRYCELETNRLGGGGVVVNGTLDLGKEITYAYGTQYTSGRALNILGGSNVPWGWIFIVNGILNWYGCEVETGSGIAVYNGGTIKIRDGIFISRLGNHTIQQGNTIIFQAGSTSDIIGLKKTLTGSLTVDNTAINILGAFTTINLSGVVSTGPMTPDNRSSTLAPVPFAVVSNWQRLQGRVATIYTVLTHFIDCASWDTSSPVAINRRTTYGTVTRHGQAEFYRNCNGKILFNGSGLQGVKLYWKDIDNGNRGVTAATEWGQTYNTYREYTATTDANGDFTSQVLEAAVYNTDVNAGANLAPAIDDRTESGHKITFKGYKYGYSLFDIQFQGNRIVASEATQPVIADANITESNKATVDAYTEIDTAEKFYDRAASHLEDNLGTFLDFIVTRSGNQIDAGSYNVTIDATASTAFDLTGNTITIKASNFSDNINTTGSFTLLNGAVFNGVLNGVLNVNNNDVLTEDIDGIFVVDTNTVTSFTIDGFIPTQIQTTGSGSTTIIGINNAKLTTTTITGTGTLALGDGLNPSSNWAVGSGTLTLNGTEGDLSGLRGLADVDYADAGGKIVYTVNDTTKIIISGTGDLTIDSDVEQLVCGVTPASGVHTIDVKNSGRLQVGKAKNVGGFTIYSSGPAIVFTNDSANNLFTVADSWANLFIDNGGTMDWYGGEIQTIGCFNAEPSSIFNTYSNEAIFVSVSSSLQATRPEAYVRMKSSNINVNGFVNKFGIYLSIGQPTTFKGYEPISSGSAIDMSNQSASNVFYDFEDLIAGKGNTRDIGGKSETWLRLLNTNLGSDITVTAQQTNAVSDQQYIVENKKGIIFNYEDEVGNIIQGAKIYLSDTDHGNRLGANQVGTNASYLNDNVYTGSSNASGNIDFSSVANSILLSVYHHNNENGNPIYSLYDSRGNNNDVSDLFTFYSISYLQTPANVTLELKGIGTLNQSQVLVTDLLISETTKATVDSYTELETPQKFYDRAKSYLYDNFQGEANTIVSREGNLIDCGSYDLVVDATSATAFSIAGNTITIKASTFTGDITTTGTITLQNGASFIGTFTDTNGTTTVTELTLTGLQSNSEIRIYQAGTTTEIDGVENSGTAFSTTTIESSVDIVVFNVGYIPVRLLAVDTSSNVTLPIQQRLDRNYNNP